MSIFWDEPENPSPPITELVAGALKADCAQFAEGELATRARELAHAISHTTAKPAKFRSDRLLIAMAFVAAFLGAGIATDAAGLAASTKALFGLSTTAFGIIVGLVTGEKPH